ncbi:MAG TPA: ribokinase [Ilumatobacteraceae bacterium]|nr:ribokinase [Ilumatobacteraceae bacterium]
MFDVCVVGSANLDLVATAARAPAPGETVLGHSYAEHAGGKGLNQAVAAARSGAHTAFLGALGTDAAGVLLRQVLELDGIDHAGVRVDSNLPTGRALITVGDDGENSIVVVPGANAAVVVDSMPPARVVLAQLEIPLDAVIDAFRRGRASGAATVLNPAPAAELPDELLALTDVVVPNEHEVTLLGGPEQLLGRGPESVVVTLGGEGARWYSSTGSVAVPSLPVEPIDTTGAGDAFCGSLCARLAAGDQIDVALIWAAAAGALATTVAGAVPSLPHAASIVAALAERR